jgi:tetratricopeptide (TPR) repeat protein
MLYARQGKYAEAVRWLNEAVRSSPTFADGYYNLGFVYAESGDHGRSVEAYKRVIELAPDYAAAYRNLALLYLKRGDRASALREYSALKSIDSELARKLFTEIYSDRILNSSSH